MTGGTDLGGICASDSPAGRAFSPTRTCMPISLRSNATFDPVEKEMKALHFREIYDNAPYYQARVPHAAGH